MRLVLLVVFLVVPLVELAVIVQVQRVVGLDWTLLALIAISIAGAVLVKREGVKAWRRFWEAASDGRLPAEEVVNGALVLLAGALLLTPGFLTDAVGLLLLVPASRSLANRWLRSRARFAVGLGPELRRRRGRQRDPDAVDVEVVDVRRSDDERPERDAVDPGERD